MRCAVARCIALRYHGYVREIHWTDESEDHIWTRHKVTPQEVEQVIYSRPRWITPGRDDSTYVFGQTDAGRYPLVVLSEAQTGDHYVVTAREMDPSEKRNFNRKA